MRKSSLILGAALAAVLVTTSACDPYQADNKSQPIVIGAAAIDAFFNEVVPLPNMDPTNGFPVFVIPFQYPEPDRAWASTAFPGLCVPANAALGIITICPVSMFPPRTGPAYAPFYLGTNSGGYNCANGQANPTEPNEVQPVPPVTPAVSHPIMPVNNTCVGGTYSYALPPLNLFSVTNIPPDIVTLSTGPNLSDFLFIQFRVQFNKLLNGKTIEPTPGTGAAKVATSGDPTFVAVTQQDLSVTGAPVVNVTCTTANVTPAGCPAGTFIVHYVPNSAVSYYGGSISAEPVDGVLLPNHRYLVGGVVQDQQGNQVTVTTSFTTLAGAAP